MRILVVEDERKTADYLHQGLTESGYVVDRAATGVDGLYLIEQQNYELVILDVNLPEKDGWQVLEDMRKDSSTRVMMLSARGRLADKVKGLDLGADDYLVKPFSFLELLARLQALTRRGRAQEPVQLRIGDLQIDLISRKAWRAGTRLDLTAKEFALLALLARRRGQIVSRTTLAEQVWDMNFDSDTNVVEVAIRRLRAKMDDPFKPKLLHNVRGMGYVLEDRT